MIQILSFDFLFNDKSMNRLIVSALPTSVPPVSAVGAENPS